MDGAFGEAMNSKGFSGRVTWLGHAALLIEAGGGGARVAIDPFIEKNPKFPKGFTAKKPYLRVTAQP